MDFMARQNVHAYRLLFNERNKVLENLLHAGLNRGLVEASYSQCYTIKSKLYVSEILLAA